MNTKRGYVRNERRMIIWLKIKHLSIMKLIANETNDSNKIYIE